MKQFFSVCSGVRLVLFLGLTHFSLAQSADTPIIDQTPASVKKADDAIIAKVNELRKDKKLLSHDEVKKQLLNPKPQVIELPPVNQKALPTEEVAAIARATNLRVGYCYLCTKCDHWHMNLAGGYAISADAVATCDHVVDTTQSIREGYLIVADHDGNVYPVTSILARSVAMDAAIVRVEGGKLTPLPLNGGVRLGAAAYCYSSPLGERQYFSDGIVNRFLWSREYQGGDKKSLDVARHMRVNFSTDWAPGSSGSAVLDQAGNAIGHVSQIAGLSKNNTGGSMMTLHTGIPAYGVRLLADALANPEDITRLSTLEAKEIAAKKVSSNEKAAAPQKKDNRK